MKKILAAILVLLMALSLTACKKGDKNISSVPTYAENGVVIENSAFEEGTQLTVAVVKDTDSKAQIVKTAIPQAKALYIYEITAQLENAAVQPDGTVNVTFPIPADFDSDKHDIEVYYVADDGTKELISSSVSENGVVAKLSHFSTYVVALVDKKADLDVTQSEDLKENGKDNQNSALGDTSRKPNSQNSSTSKNPTISNTASTTSKKPSANNTDSGSGLQGTTNTPSVPSVSEPEPESSQLTRPQPQPTKPQANTSFSAYKVNGNDCVQSSISFSADMKSMDYVESMGTDIDYCIEKGYLDHMTMDELLEGCFEYNGVKYYVGAGDGAPYTIESITVDQINLDCDGDKFVLKYTLIDDTMTIIFCQTDCTWSHFKAGDVFKLEK